MYKMTDKSTTVTDDVSNEQPTADSTQQIPSTNSSATNQPNQSSQFNHTDQQHQQTTPPTDPLRCTTQIQQTTQGNSLIIVIQIPPTFVSDRQPQLVVLPTTTQPAVTTQAVQEVGTNIHQPSDNNVS